VEKVEGIGGWRRWRGLGRGGDPTQSSGVKGGQLGFWPSASFGKEAAAESREMAAARIMMMGWEEEEEGMGPIPGNIF
jgi:hypothetical protein